MPCYSRQRPLEKLVWTRLLFLRMSIHIQKNNLIISLILEILYFQESWNLSDCLGTFCVINQKQEFFKTWDLRRQVKDKKNLPKSQHLFPNFTQEAGSHFCFTPADTKNCPFYPCCGKNLMQIWKVLLIGLNNCKNYLLK